MTGLRSFFSDSARGLGLALLGSFALAACGGGGGGYGGTVPPPPTTYTIGGSISGLSGAGLVLEDNGGADLPVSANSTTFTFATAVISGGAYLVTVKTQPSGESCTVSSGSGTVGTANVTGVVVNCSTTATPTYTIGGSITGLTAAGLILKDNGGDNLTVAANAVSFTFTTKLASGTAYAVTIATQPTGLTCAVTAGSGNVASANVTTPAISCGAAPTYAIGGSVTGLPSGSSVVLLDNGSDSLTVTSASNTTATSFQFSTKISSGGTYAVTISTQSNATPPQFCIPSRATGTANAAVTTVSVVCRNTGSYVYVGTAAPNLTPKGAIQQFDIDPATGLLIPDSKLPTTASSPDAIVLNSSHTFGFVAYQNPGSPSGSIVGDQINSGNGNLSDVNFGHPINDSASETPTSLLIDPSGQYLLAGIDANGAAGHIGIYQISGGDIVKELPGSEYFAAGNASGAGGNFADAMVMDAAGTFLFVINPASGTLSAFSATLGASLPNNPTANDITGVTGSPFSFGGTPSAIAIYPAGGFFYVTDSANGTVNAYSYSGVTTNLTLTLISKYAVGSGAGSTPRSVAIDPSGRFLYVSNATDATVSAFSINAATGALVSINNGNASISTGAKPSTVQTALTVDPSGQFVYVANGSDATLTSLVINQATGALGSAVNQFAIKNSNGLDANSTTIAIY